MTPERDLDAWLFDDAAGVDVGRGYTLTWTVGPDGSRWPMLVDERQVDEQLVATRPEHFVSAAPHELTGKMPDEFQQFRCGQRTNSGRGCRIVVQGPGQRCSHHPEPETPTPTPPAGATSTDASSPSKRASRPRPDDEDQRPLFDIEPLRDRP